MPSRPERIDRTRMTRSGHRQDRNAAAQRSPAVPYGVLIFGRTEAVPNPISEHFRSNPRARWPDHGRPRVPQTERESL